MQNVEAILERQVRFVFSILISSYEYLSYWSKNEYLKNLFSNKITMKMYRGKCSISAIVREK